MIGKGGFSESFPQIANSDEFLPPDTPLQHA